MTSKQGPSLPLQRQLSYNVNHLFSCLKKVKDWLDYLLPTFYLLPQVSVQVLVNISHSESKAKVAVLHFLLIFETKRTLFPSTITLFCNVMQKTLGQHGGFESRVSDKVVKGWCWNKPEEPHVSSPLSFPSVCRVHSSSVGVLSATLFHSLIIWWCLVCTFCLF